MDADILQKVLLRNCKISFFFKVYDNGPNNDGTLSFYVMLC